MSRYTFKLPDLGEGIVSSEVVAWRVAPGDTVREDDPLVEMSTDKAVVEVPSPVSGRVLTLGGKPGDVIAVGADLVVFETGDAVSAVKEESAAAMDDTAHRTETAAQDGVATTVRVRASPSTRRRAKLAGIDLTVLTGSGPGGRIRRVDLDGALLKSGICADATMATATAPPATPPTDEDIREKLPVVGVRRVIARRMAEAKRTIPHFSYVEEIDVTELETLRTQLNAQQLGSGAALTYLPFIVLAVVRAIEEFPQVNAWYEAASETVVRLRAVHVGIATQTPDGLKVPVVRDAHKRTLGDLAAEIGRVSESARTRRTRREDLTGSTITVSSLGKLGGIATTPIINAPEVAILGVNRAVDRPVVYAGQIAVRRMMNVSASFDHRFVDGYDAAAFVQAVKLRLESPALLLQDTRT